MDDARPGTVSRVSGSARSRLAAAIVLGLAARLSLAWVTPAPQPNDAAIFGSWARTLRDHPLGEFYAHAGGPDHLPGDLWLLKLLQVGFTATGHGDFGSHAFQFLLKAVPTTADVVIGVLVFSLVRTWASETTAVRAAQWYLLNPAAIMLSTVWGQWDAVSAAAVLAGFLMVVRGGNGWIWCAPFLAWGLLIKPTLVIVVGMVLLWLVLVARPWAGAARAPRLAVRGLLSSSGLGIATAAVIVAPFRIGLMWSPPGGSSLVERARFAADLYPYTTMGASNLWLLVDKSVIGPPDDVARWGSLTPARAATMLVIFVLAMTVVVARGAFRAGRQQEALLWAGATAMFGACLVMTRVHERYYFPVLVLLLLWASTRDLDTVGATFYWVFSAFFVADLTVVIDWFTRSDGFAHQPAVLVVLGALHMCFFIGLLAAQCRSGRSDSLTVGAPSAATAARRTAPG